ncbi:basic-leucine zipper transcription factor A isoform X2 [Nilaparvata lugens]|uniref:basic-leucine zipper transcription factor A isoform X2 n=1 Tax=Nilaparvata lugens TaxID=108931 RepID=UPI00193E7F65|nr:basic-leucine zipper transcription factor A isoform X2 [Nilaparvata lugens]
MWSDTQEQPFAMGLRGTAIKRKLSDQDGGPPAAAAVAVVQTPTKTARPDQWGATDVQQHHHHQQQQQQQHHIQQNSYNGGQQQQQQQQRFYCFDDYRQLQQQQQQQQCYEQQQQQQTIRRDENGKSYLELGSWSGRGGGRVRPQSPASRCCEARTNWCVRGPACYRQRRLAVLNISMCKLGRYRQFSDPSLHRSVLICNTLRLIEKEMEQEGYFDANTSSNDVPTSTSTPEPPQFPQVPVPYEPPRVPTPFPPSDSSSSSSTSSSSSSSVSSTSSDDDRSINWGSVLSLSSQSDLDPLNNNDCLGGGDSSSSDFNHDLDDFLPAWKAVEPSSSAGELESIMHVLVGT